MIISSTEFNQLMLQLGPFESRSNIAVAVSGGPDSLCLAMLLAGWANQEQHSLTGLIVDHRLRPESTDEAQHAQSQLSNLGIASVILTWYGDKPVTCIQENARDMRYQLLINWCLQHNHPHLFTGHHYQDQQETALWRLWRGSDIWGLAGMSVQTQRDNITLYRPMLQMSKQRIESTLNLTSLQAIIDPSNFNEQFARVAVRSKLSQLPMLPLQSLGRLRRSFEVWRENLIKSAVIMSPYGYLTLDFIAFKRLSLPFQEFLLNHLLRVITHRQYPIVRKKLLITIKDLMNQPHKIRTQGGCILYVRHNKIVIIKQWINCQALIIDNTHATKSMSWDDRFIIELNENCTASLEAQPISVRCMGEQGWLQICQQYQSSTFTEIPYHARLALPTLWHGKTMIGICHFSMLFKNDCSAINDVKFKPTTQLVPPIFKILADTDD